MPSTRRGAVHLYYELDGPVGAPPLVLVRGFARSSRYWLRFREHLARSFRLLLVDNRGVGRSDAPAPPYSTKGMGDDVVAVMDDAGLREAHVFGISMGGMIAQWIAIRHPRRVRRLVLAATTCGGSRALPVTWPARLALLRAGALPFPEAIRSTAPWVLAPPFLARRGDVVDTWAELAAREPPPLAGIVGQLLAVARHDAWRALGAISAPTLVMTGDADRLIPWRNSYHIVERIPDARIEVVDGGGHDFPTERPEETARALRRFLSSEL